MTVEGEEGTGRRNAAEVVPIGPLPAETEGPGAPLAALGDHLGELRLRLLRALAAVGIVFVAGLVFYRQLWMILLWPRARAAATLGVDADIVFPLRLDAPQAGIVAVAKIAFGAGVLLALPVVIREVWAFLTPGLTERERRAVGPIFLFGSGLFLLGAAVAFLVVVPLGLDFLVRFNRTLPGATNLWPLGAYLSFLFMASAGFGVAFETPLVMMALARVGLVRPETMLRQWRWVILGSVTLGAVLTPPDPVTQLVLAGMLLLLFLLGWILAARVAPETNRSPTAPRDERTET